MNYLQPLHGLQEMELHLFGHTYKGELLATRYTTNKALALEFALYDGEIVTTISTNLDEPPQAWDCFWLKNWSENEGIEKFLTKYSIATPTGRSRRSGFVQVTEWKLNPGFKEQLIEEQL